MKLLHQIKHFLFPDLCALCGGVLFASDEIRQNLCKTCLGEIESEQDAKCEVCGKPLISEINICLPCRSNTERSYERLWTLFPYTGKYRKLLTAYKFSKKLGIADFLAQKALEIIEQQPLLKDAVIVPVPPRPGKIKENGWDQVEQLVKRMEKLSGYKINRCLKRRKSKVQKELTRMERIENLKGRIYLNLNKPAPKTVLIIDDVITTGSTIEACAAILKENGAEKVYAFCLFYD